MTNVGIFNVGLFNDMIEKISNHCFKFNFPENLLNKNIDISNSKNRFLFYYSIVGKRIMQIYACEYLLAKIKLHY